MTLINIRNLGITLSSPLFSRLNLAVNAGDRIGLVAANGRGKSTLFRCMAGALEATEGEITRAREATVGYVEQNVPAPLLPLSFYEAVLDALPADARRQGGIKRIVPRRAESREIILAKPADAGLIHTDLGDCREIQTGDLLE